MIRRLLAGLIVGALLVWANCALAQQSYPLLTGEVLTGEPVSFNQQGVVLKRPDGSFSSRMGWTNFTEAALKQLGQNPKAKPFVDQLIEAEEEEQAKKGPVEITVKAPPRIERANLKAGIGALFSSPLSILLLFLVWAANIYAAFEVSIFRNYPWPLVCGVAAVVPVIGPILFLCLPSHVIVPQTTEELMEAHYAAQAEAPVAEIAMAGPAEAAAAAAAPAHAAPAGPPHTVYKRGQTTFNRRFFETKLANFLRVTPSEAEKDLVLFIKSSRGEHTGTRITRITPDSLLLHVVKAGASHDVDIPFTEIAEVHVKHKES
jgi:hypothetical protein